MKTKKKATVAPAARVQACGCAERYAANCERGIHLRDGLLGIAPGSREEVPDHNLLAVALVECPDGDIVRDGIEACARELRVVWLARQALNHSIHDEDLLAVESGIAARLEVLAVLQRRTEEAARQRRIEAATSGGPRADHHHVSRARRKSR